MVDWGHVLRWLAEHHGVREDLRTLMGFILTVTNGEIAADALIQRIIEVAPEYEEIMGSVARELEQRGAERGARRRLRRMLVARFGELDPTIEARSTKRPRRISTAGA